MENYIFFGAQRTIVFGLFPRNTLLCGCDFTRLFAFFSNSSRYTAFCYKFLALECTTNIRILFSCWLGKTFQVHVIDRKTETQVGQRLSSGVCTELSVCHCLRSSKLLDSTDGYGIYYKLKIIITIKNFKSLYSKTIVFNNIYMYRLYVHIYKYRLTYMYTIPSVCIINKATITTNSILPLPW